MRKILVTGGAGFIGSNFILSMISDMNSEIINLDKLTYAGNTENLKTIEANPAYSFIKGDICDRELVKSIFQNNKPDAVVHFAAETHVDRSLPFPENFVRTNIDGTFTLLDETLKYWEKIQGKFKSGFRFIHISTDEVFGSLGPDEPAFTENHPYRPNSPYSASKASADHLVRAYNKTYGLPISGINASNNYGPYQYPEKLIPLIILNAIDGKELPVYGDGENIRDWLYVGDHTEAIKIVLNKGRTSEFYNIGGNCQKKNIEVVETVCGILDEIAVNSPYRPHKKLIKFVGDRPGHDFRYAMDISKISSETGWKPLETFETGIEKTVRWYLGNTGWLESIKTKNYRSWIERNYTSGR